MALVKGTNCGFVTTAPTADPGGTNWVLDTYAYGFKDVAPAGAAKVTEIGWWCDNATEAADYDVGIYSHDAVNNRPNGLIGVARNNAKGTTSGWKRVTGLNISISAATTYWIGVQLDNTATNTNYNYTGQAGEKDDWKTSQTSLPDPWGTSSGTGADLTAFYAVVAGQIVNLAATIAGVGGLAAAPKVQRKLSAVIAGVGAVSALAKVERKLAATIAGLGGLAAAPKVERKLSAAIAGVGGLAGSLSIGPAAVGGTFASLLKDWPIETGPSLAEDWLT